MLQQCYLAEFSCCKKSFSVVAFKDGDKYILWTFAILPDLFQSYCVQIE